VSVAFTEVPPEVTVITTVVLTETELVVIVNEPVDAPIGSLTNGGTEATAGLLL